MPIFDESGRLIRGEDGKEMVERYERKTYSTHRCTQSIVNAMSVRLEKERYDDRPYWGLYKRELSEWYSFFTTRVVRDIYYCPFCGEKLDPPKEEKHDTERTIG